MHHLVGEWHWQVDDMAQLTDSFTSTDWSEFEPS